MSGPCYMGEEATAAGFRLAGADVRVVEQGESAAFTAGGAEASLVLVSSSIAARARGSVLDAALAALSPLMVIVPDVRDEVREPDLAVRLRHELGLEESP
jgi:vacuolar-type H+-ATPase subunit F/Vma7